MSDLTSVTIYTDGACRGNPGPGGWGALIQWGEHKKELSGGTPDTTNNRMELTAAIMALEALTRSMPVNIYTDSVYVRDGMTKWLEAWKARNWQTAAKKPVKNVDLWQRLEQAQQSHQVTWHWIKGHAGHPGNERADELARQSIPLKS